MFLVTTEIATEFSRFIFGVNLLIVLLLQQRSRHPREMVVAPKVATSRCALSFIFRARI